MGKTLCKIKKIRKKDLKAHIKHVTEPRFVCKSCGRVADKKKLLCSPQKIK